MELLAYVLGIFGLIVLVNGVKPTMKRIEKSTDKELAKGVGFIAVPMAAAIYGLEIIVILVQAYVFTLLTAVFVGMAINVHH